MDLSVEPPDDVKKAILRYDYFDQNLPVYQYYNWCLDFLHSVLPRITPDTVNEPRPVEYFREVQLLMRKACSSYLQHKEEQEQ